MRIRTSILVYAFLLSLLTLSCAKQEDDPEPEQQREGDYELINLPTNNAEKITAVDTVRYNGKSFPVYDITVTGSEEELKKIEVGKVIYVHNKETGGKVVLVTEIKGNLKSTTNLKGGIAMVILGIQTTLDMYFGDEKSELLFATTSNRSRNSTKIDNKILGADPYSLTSSDFKFEIKPKENLSVEVTSKPDKLFQSKVSGTLWQSGDSLSSIKLNGSLSLHPSFDLNLKYEPKLVEEGSSTYSSVLSWLEAAAVPDAVMAQYRDKDYFLGNMKQLRTNIYTDVDFDLSFTVKLSKKIEHKTNIPFARLIVASPSVTTFTDAAFEINLSALAAGEYELSGGITNDLVLGVNLDRALSNAVWYYDYNNDAKGSAKLKGKVELTKGVSIVFDTEVYVLGLFGPHFKVGPVIEAKATANAVYDMNDGMAYDWKFAIDYGMNGEASLDLSLFHLDAATTQVYKMENIEIRRNLYSAPDSIKVVDGDKQEGTEGQKLPKPITVKVYDSNNTLIKSPWPTVPVYFETSDGSLNHNGTVFSNDDGSASTEWTLGMGKEEQTLSAFLKEEGNKKSKIEITAMAEKDKFLAELMEDGSMYFRCTSDAYFDFHYKHCANTAPGIKTQLKWLTSDASKVSFSDRIKAYAPSGKGSLSGTVLTATQEKHNEEEGVSWTGNHKIVFDTSFQNIISLESSFSRTLPRSDGQGDYTVKMTIKAQDIPFEGNSWAGRAYVLYGDDIKNKITSMTYEKSYGENMCQETFASFDNVKPNDRISFHFGKVID